MNWLDLFRATRRAGVPLVAINTPDPASTMREIGRLYQSKCPIVQWDACRGVQPLNDLGRGVASMTGEGADDITIGQPAMFLSKAADYPGGEKDGTIVFMHNAQACWEAGLMVVQAAWNLRDAFKADHRTLVLLSVDHKLPISLAQDVVVIDEPLPDMERLAEIVKETTSITKVGKDDLARATEAVRALSSFAAEQEIAMAVTREGINLQQLRNGQRKVIAQTQGLTFDDGDETFDDIGGLENAKEFGRRLFTGPHPPAVVVRIEEIEKAMGDGPNNLSSNSIDADALQVFLSAMEDKGWYGQIAFGPPGSGKSLYSKALANTFDRLPLVFDINAAKGGIVGTSEANIRKIVKTLYALGGREVFFVASMNKATIKPELMRRFRFGTWMFDLPDDDEKRVIWKIKRAKYGIPDDDEQPDDTDWSGSDINNLCEAVWRMGGTLKDAMAFLSSNSRATPEVIKAARDQAEGKYIAASFPGVYHRKAAGKARKITV